MEKRREEKKKKRKKEEKSLFRFLREIIETIIFTGSSILVFCLVSENFQNSVVFLVFLS